MDTMNTENRHIFISINPREWRMNPESVDTASIAEFENGMICESGGIFYPAACRRARLEDDLRGFEKRIENVLND